MGYVEKGFMTFRSTQDGEQLMANFTAKIIEEIRFMDETNILDTQLTIVGESPGEKENKPNVLPPIKVGADEYNSMSWPIKRWGTRAIIMPGGGIKDDLRAAIQLASTPKVTCVYKHTGWVKIGKRATYLHAGGGIQEKGNAKDIKISLPQDMSQYDLSDAPPAEEAAKLTLQLLDLGPSELMWPLLAATFAPLYTACDFAIHLAGRTGTYKSEILSIFLAHYGAGFDARHLPGSWSSTGNALEAQAHIAKNAPFVIDDFVPCGTSWQQKSYQTNADKIIRAQGNQSGRARLTDASSLQQTMYPRGIVLSTGEDIPEGHSVRARMMILEIAPDDVTTGRLTMAQGNRAKYKGTTVGLIQKIAKKPPNLKPRAEALRDKSITIGHSRTPTMVGTLQAVAEQITEAMVEFGAMTEKEKKDNDQYAWEAITKAGQNQVQYLESSDPVEQFLIALRNVFSQKVAHVRRLNGGVPKGGEMLGWTGDGNGDGNPLLFRSHGPCIGWIDWDAGELLLDINVGYPIVRKIGGNEVTIGKQTLTKRMKESGVLTRTDDVRQRNAIRVTAENHPRIVIALCIKRALNTEERPG
jgi:hypothetical protein